MLYLTEGDYINAGLSALSIIPGADAFTKTGKASKVLGNGIVESGLKHLDNVADGIKKLVKKADDAIDLEKHLPKKLLKEEAEAFAKKADKVADDVVEDAAKAIKRGRETIKYNEVKTFTAEETNQWFIDNVKPDYKPPYKLRTLVKEIELTENTTFVRVYDNMPDGSGMYGSWVMKADDIKGLTPLEIKNKFALPKPLNMYAMWNWRLELT